MLVGVLDLVDDIALAPVATLGLGVLDVGVPASAVDFLAAVLAADALLVGEIPVRRSVHVRSWIESRGSSLQSMTGNRLTDRP